MDIRELTGKWYLSKRIEKRILDFKWFSVTRYNDVGFDVMVQVKTARWSDESYGNGGGCYSPERTEYQRATKSDLIELGINCV